MEAQAAQPSPSPRPLRSSLPPGPPESSIAQGMRFGRDPYGFLDDCARSYGDLFSLRLPGDPPRVVTSDPALVRQIFALRPDDYEQQAQSFFLNIGEGSLLFLDGERHRRERQIIMPHLHGDRLRSYATIMKSATDEAIADWKPGVSIPIHAVLQKVTLDIVIQCVFGITGAGAMAELREPLLAWINGVLTQSVAIAGLLVTATRLRRFLDAAVRRSAARYPRRGLGFLPWDKWGDSKADVLRLVREQVERCRREGTEGRTDVLAMLSDARYEDGTPMDVDDIVDQLITLLVGGHETTANTLAWTLYHALPRPDVMAEIRAELDKVFGGGPVDPHRAGELTYLDACIKESMRLVPIAPAVGRNLTRPVQLRDYEVPAGTILWASPYLTHRRADLWPDPEAFRPARFLDASSAPTNHFFPFGGGRRTCVGMAFASFEMRIVLAELLHRARLRLTPGVHVRPEVRGITIAPSETLSVIADGILPA